MNAILRRSRQIIVILVVLFAAAWVSGEAGQWLLRWRAGKLLTSIRSLEVGHSSWADAQKVIGTWSKWGASDGHCSEQACSYRINLVQTLPPVLEGYPGSNPTGAVKNWLPRAMGHLGLRSAAVRAEIVVNNGIVTEKWFGEQVTLPVRDWSVLANYVPYLSVASHGTSRFHDHPRDPDQTFPNRLVRTYPNGLSVSFSPDEDASERSRLMDFQFTCITRLIPCRDVSEILPEGSRTLQQEKHSPSTR